MSHESILFSSLFLTAFRYSLLPSSEAIDDELKNLVAETVATYGKAMDNMDMDAEIAKNKAKAQKKREKMHLEATDGSVKNIANMKTNSSNVKDIAKMNGAKSGNNNNSEDKKYKKGSIASIAHMMDQSEEE